jgi:plasmid maintenance system killer protein
VNLFETAYDELHGNVESYWDLWLNQQWELWVNAEWYIDKFSSSATFLNGRKSKCRK